MEIEFDLGRESLFVMIDGQEINADAGSKEDRIIAAISIDDDPQVESCLLYTSLAALSQLDCKELLPLLMERAKELEHMTVTAETVSYTHLSSGRACGAVCAGKALWRAGIRNSI